MADLTARITGGVGTHKDLHVAAALDDLGKLLGTQSFPTTTAGYRALLGWLRGFGTVVAVGIEGTGSWGAGLARHLAAADVKVLEVNRPNRQPPAAGQVRPGRRRGRGPLRAGRAGHRHPKGNNGVIESIRLLRLARRSAVKGRIQAANQMHTVIDTAPEELRAQLIGLTSTARVARCSRLRPGDVATPLGAAKLALVSLGRRWSALDDEIEMLSGELGRLVALAAPSLVAVKGVGTDVAGALLTAAGDNPERLVSEASFAAPCGASPIPASSGRSQRHRLNRGGDRQANSALYTVVLSRLTWDDRTKAYMAKRTAEGKSKREAIRCLKRYVARELYREICKTSDDLKSGSLSTDILKMLLDNP
jgi:transposase